MTIKFLSGLGESYNSVPINLAVNDESTPQSVAGIPPEQALWEVPQYVMDAEPAPSESEAPNKDQAAEESDLSLEFEMPWMPEATPDP